MSDAVGKAALLVAFPVVAGSLGAIIAAFRRPGPKLTSAVQHFAAGVVFAAVAGEVLPDLRSQGRIVAVILGFSAGVAVLLALGAYGRRQEEAAAAREEGASRALPLGLLAAVGIDLLIDGLLIGLGSTLGPSQSLILTIALTIEILFLGLAVCLQLLDIGISPTRAATVTAVLGLATAVGAIGSAALLGDASETTLAAVLAFGAAALLYLVVEELLVEAHEEAETPILGAMFFVGFLGLYLLAEIAA